MRKRTTEYQADSEPLVNSTTDIVAIRINNTAKGQNSRSIGAGQMT